MPRNAILLAALLASAFAASAQAADAALFSNAGQLSTGKAKLAEDGIAGVAGAPANGSFAAEKTMKFSGGSLFGASTAGKSGALANPDLVAKLTASAHSFSAGGAVGLEGGAHKDSAFSSGGSAGLDGGDHKDGSFARGGAAGLTSGENTNGLLKAGLAARASLLSLTK